MSRILIIGTASGGSLARAVAKVLGDGHDCEVVEDYDILSTPCSASAPHDREIVIALDREVREMSLKPPRHQRERTHPTSPRQRGGW